MLKPHQIDVPGGARAFSGGALHVEAYEMGECRILVTREDFADAREHIRDYRWRLSIAHADRYPTIEEVIEARKVLPEDIHFAMPFPHRAYWLARPMPALDLIEIQDGMLTAQLEYEAIQRRESGAGEIW